MRRRLMGNKVYDPFNGYPYVDMGEAGIWATYPIGVTNWQTCFDDILYFAWGETEGFTYEQINLGERIFNWANYKLCNGTQNTLTKYCILSSYGKVDGLTQLELEDDAAHIYMGGQWRMPTSEEFAVLYNNTVAGEGAKDSYGWVEDYKGMGIYGLLRKSKTNGNTIFFPAAGYADEGSVVDLYGFYWSSSLNISSQGYCFGLKRGLVRPQNGNERSRGFSIRGFIPKS